MNPPLTVTPLEDRSLPSSLAAPQVFAPVPILVDVPAKVAQLPKADSGDGRDGPGDVTLMGLRRNHNETFVRRKGKR